MKWKMPEALYLRTSSQAVFKDDIPAMHHSRISFTGFGGAMNDAFQVGIVQIWGSFAQGNNPLKP